MKCRNLFKSVCMGVLFGGLFTLMSCQKENKKTSEDAAFNTVGRQTQSDQFADINELAGKNADESCDSEKSKKLIIENQDSLKPAQLQGGDSGCAVPK